MVRLCVCVRVCGVWAIWFLFFSVIMELGFLFWFFRDLLAFFVVSSGGVVVLVVV